MQRNLVTTIKIAKGYTQVACIENISSNLVELFNNTMWTSNTLEQTRFIKDSVIEINKIIGGKVESVIAIVESNVKTNLEIKMIEKEITVASSFVTKNDINNVIQLAKQQYISGDQKIILAQPIRFTVSDIIEKSYDQAPLNKKGNKLKVRLAVSLININVADYISQVIDNAGLKVSQILTETHTIAQETISNSALSVGAISVHVGINRTLISVIVNSATVSSLELPLGYKHLINKVSETFSCSQENASNLLRVHGRLTKGTDQVIFTSQDGIKNVSFTEQHLNAIVSQFIAKVVKDTELFISKHKSLKDLAITISGEIINFIGLEQYATQLFSTNYITIYKPLMFISTNKKNSETIGTIHFIERFDKVLGKNFHTIVMTNPNLISTMIENKKINGFAKILNILGGKHVIR